VLHLCPTARVARQINRVLYPESKHNMSTPTQAPAAGGVLSVMIAEPHTTPSAITVPLNSILRLTNDSVQYPKFQIHFVGPSPDGTKKVFKGEASVDIPVTEEGSFLYLICHIKKDGSHLTSGPFAARSCFPCP
jgi:hypothetical protein